MFGFILDGISTRTEGQIRPPGDLPNKMVTARTHATQALTKAAELMKKFYDAKATTNPRFL